MKRTEQSKTFFENARKYVAGGVHTPLFDIHKANPGIFCAASAKGSTMTDIDGNNYVDFVCGYGSLILGHAHPAVVHALQEQSQKGFIYTLPSAHELEYSQCLVESSEALDQIRLTCSGTEAVMTAVRLAKNYTSRFKIAKFTGSYHGHADSVLGKFYPDAKKGEFGIDPAIYDNTLMLTYGDVDGLDRLFKEHAPQLAAVLMEPVPCNAGLAPLEIEFLKMVRQYCDQYGVILIFDEVITGFRFNYGSVANDYPIKPDLMTFGKVIGGGLAIGAYGGKQDVMSYHNSEKTGFHFSGTFTANPLVITTGLITIKELAKDGFYLHLETLGEALEAAFYERLKKFGNCLQLRRKGSVFALKRVKFGQDYPEALRDYSQLHTLMLERGYLMTPSPFETMYLSAAHSIQDIHSFIESLDETLSQTC